MTNFGLLMNIGALLFVVRGVVEEGVMYGMANGMICG